MKKVTIKKKGRTEVIDVVLTKENTLLWLERKYNEIGVCIGTYLTEEDECGNELNSREVDYEILGKDELEFRAKQQD